MKFTNTVPPKVELLGERQDLPLLMLVFLVVLCMFQKEYDELDLGVVFRRYPFGASPSLLSQVLLLW